MMWLGWGGPVRPPWIKVATAWGSATLCLGVGGSPTTFFWVCSVGMRRMRLGPRLLCRIRCLWSLCVYLTPRLVSVGNDCRVPGQCEFTIAYQRGWPNQNPSGLAWDFPYQTLPDPVLAVRNPLVVLDWSTNCYHPPDLALLLPCVTFTNDYHRGLGQGHWCECSRRRGCHMGSRVEGYRCIERWRTVGHTGEPYTHSERVRTVRVGVEKIFRKNISWSACILNPMVVKLVGQW